MATLWKALAGLTLLCASANAWSQQAPTSNVEIKAMFDADQAARKDMSKIQPMKLYQEDAERRKRTRALLEAGALRTGDDYYYAAFIFQHGSEPSDYLLAHSLAIAAIPEGRKDAKWIAAATLDRYLQALHQPQIYGTQFSTKMDGVTTQAPYDRELVPDRLRQVLGVPVLADQERRKAELQAKFNRRSAGPAVNPRTRD